MNITNNAFIGFGAKISPNLQAQIYKQGLEHRSSQKIQSTLQDKMQSLADWGSENAKIVICKNFKGNYSLGIKLPLDCGYAGTWAIERLGGRTELSQFLSLTAEHIEKTENTIKFLYKKHGMQIFERTK